MMGISYSLVKVCLLVLFLACFLFTVGKAQAASLANARDTITTSRPSAASPLSATLGSSDGAASIFNNGSFYLASDSAKVIRTSTNGIIVGSVPIASQSAALTTVYFGGSPGSAAQAGTDVLFVPITAVHTIQFTTATAIPAGGDVLITFPGATNNDTASPSATLFAFNNLNAAGGLPSTVVTDNITCNGSSFVSSPQIMCESTAGVSAGVTVTIIIGCTAQSGGACTTQSPRLINPTKAQSSGNADIWKVRIDTRDAADINLDSATVAVGTIESVTIRATIDPSLTFTITGLNNNAAWSTGNAGCSAVETTNSGLASTSTDVNLGTVSNTPSGTNTKIRNIAGQRIDITTNGANGYVLTATSSGHLINPATGFFLNDSTSPIAFPSAQNFFGLHPCGLDVTAATWNSTASQTCNSYITGSTDPICLYAWPNTVTPISLASDTTGPIGVNAGVTGNGVTSVSYAVGADAGVPPGEYRTVVTYVATPAF